MDDDQLIAEAWEEFQADLEPQIKSWSDAVRARLEEVGPPSGKLKSFRLPSLLTKGMWDESKHPRNHLGHFAGKLKEHISGLTGHADEHGHAEHWAGHLSKLTQAEVYHVISKAGIEGARPSDSKTALIQRARLRLTALVRARERAQA